MLKFLPLQIICWVIDVFAALVAVGMILQVYDHVDRYQLLIHPSNSDLRATVEAIVTTIVAGVILVSMLLVFTQVARVMLRIERNTYEQAASQQAMQDDVRAMLNAVQEGRDATTQRLPADAE